jgi:hypothetical protein
MEQNWEQNMHGGYRDGSRIGYSDFDKNFKIFYASGKRFINILGKAFSYTVL